MSDMLGRRLGEYQVLRRIGSGGMADVYAARQLKLQRDVALKILRSDSRYHDDDGDDSNLKRFQREAQAAARLNHPSIVQVYEFGEVDGVHFIAQELVDGINLKQCLDRDGPCNANQAIEILRCVAGALQVAHDAGVTHRDIKPENIMRGADDSIKVTDFGLARLLTPIDASTADLTKAGLTLGTPRYMSPEQIQGHVVDARSDVYSLGVTMYHLLTGSPPFDAAEPLALAVKHINETPLPLDHARGTSDLPDWLVSLVMQCLQKSPDARFESAAALLSVIEAQGTTGLSDQSIRSLSGFGSITTGSSPTLGASAATIQLQRVVDRNIAERRKRIRGRWLVGLSTVLAALVGWAVASQTEAKSLIENLRGPTVTRADTIGEQYLIAVTRNDVPGWKAVSKYFPADEDQSRIEFHQKSKLQLARLLIEQKHFQEATLELDDLQKAPNVKRLYRLVASVHRHSIAEATNDPRRASELKSQIAREVQELESDNPAAVDQFRRIVPSAERMKLGLLN